MHSMKDIEKAEQIITALRKLDDRDQALYLISLLGVLKIDSPRSIVDAARWSCLPLLEKTEKALDASA